MNKIDVERTLGVDPQAGRGFPRGQDHDVDFDRLVAEMVAIIRRQSRLIIAVALAMLTLALFYVALRPSQYRATTTILIDPARANVLQSQQVLALPTVDSGTVDSQVEILKSDIVAQNLVRRLKLAEDPEFNRTSAVRALLNPLLRVLSGSSEPSSDEQERNTAAAVQRNLTVQRSGTSYIIEVSFVSLDPEKAATIANAVSDVFLDLQISTRFDAARRASRWLMERSDELRARVIRADEAVQNYKNQHGLVEAGGRLLVEQQVSDMSGQLGLLRSQTAEALVRLNQVGQLIATGDLDGGGIDIGQESVIARLRQQTSDLSRREKELEQRFGASHRLVLDARSELRSLRRQLEEEFGKLQESLRSAHEVAIQKQKAMEAAFKAKSAEFAALRDKEIYLRELQRDATSVRQLFETFTNRHKEVLQQESMPMMDARVVAQATKPTRPSNPRLTIVLVAAFAVGTVLGIGIALIRDRADRTIRRISDAESCVGKPVLAVLEDLSEASGATRTSMIESSNAQRNERFVPMDRLLPTTTGILRYVALHPFSGFTEAFRALRVSLILNGGVMPKVIGITSTVPNEGKTMVTNNFAQYLAGTGLRVLMIDGDVRNPTMSQQLCPNERRGLPEVLLNRVSWRDLVYVDPITRLRMLPANSSELGGSLADLLGTRAFADLIAEVSAEFDIVVVDFAPLAGTFDARAASQSIDAFLYVVGWGGVRRDTVSRAVNDAPEVRDKIAGVILNQIEAKRFKLFDNYLEAPQYGYAYGAGAGYGRRNG